MVGVNLVAVCRYNGMCPFKRVRKLGRRWKVRVPVCKWEGTCNQKEVKSSYELRFGALAKFKR